MVKYLRKLRLNIISTKLNNLLEYFIILERSFQYKLGSKFANYIYKYPFQNLKIKKLPPKKFYIFTWGPTGDLALISSLTQYIKIKYPKVQIYLITSYKYKKLAALNTDIKKVIPIKTPLLPSYKFIEKIAKKLDYDVFLIATPHPNLRYLIPQIPIAQMAFFLYRDLPKKIPVPKLLMPTSKKNKGNYFILNLEAATFGWHENTPKPEQITQMTQKIIENNPKVQFYINQKNSNIENFGYKNTTIYKGDFNNLLALASNSLGFISIRNGLNDVLAATAPIPQFIIFPEGDFPSRGGINCLEWASLKTIGYKTKITESLINRNNPDSIKTNIKNIDGFIKKIIREQK